MSLFSRGFERQLAEQGIGHVIGKRPSEQKFHRQVVDPLRILFRIGPFGLEPALRNDVADGTCRRFKLLPDTGLLDIHDAVEREMPFVQGVAGARKLDRSHPVLLENAL